MARRSRITTQRAPVSFRNTEAEALTDDEIGFSFGENWRKFLDRVDEDRLRYAEESLRSSFGGHRLEGRSFIDAGCGSGVFSLAAHRLGTRELMSVDIDPNSVECAEFLRERAGSPESWSVRQGSLLDTEFVAGLGTADMVYSWGVLHHTGRMWQALENTMALVAPGGLFCLALYRPPRRQRLQMQLKRTYNRSTRLVKLLMATAYFVKEVVMGSIHQRTFPWVYIRIYGRGSRGMSVWRDVEDWLGGLPCEFTEASEVEQFVSARGFRVEDVLLGGSGGLNEYLLRRES